MANTKSARQHRDDTHCGHTVKPASETDARRTLPSGKENGYVIRPRRTGQKDTADVINNKETNLHPRRVVAEKGVYVPTYI